MVDRPKFELGGKPAQPKPPGEEISTAPIYQANEANGPVSAGTELSATDTDGQRLALGVDAAGYHPVILFGNANSGKTSLLLSLLALIRTEPDLHCGLHLGDPILPLDTPYGRFIHDQAAGFYGKKTQDFIEGNASPKTAIDAPFFIPVVLTPEGKPELRFAFMESNGEWYRPDRTNDRLFPELRKQIEVFLATFQGPITFIHLLPYTQKPVYSADRDQLGDIEETREASIAIKGALEAYKSARPNKQDDRHLMLVTKWDAHDPAQVSKIEVLSEPGSEPFEFAHERYEQAVTSFVGLGLRRDQRQFSEYCAGLIAGSKLTMPKRGDPLREAILAYPKNLWTWLYQTALIQLGEHAVSPFPAPKQPGWFAKFLNRWF